MVGTAHPTRVARRERISDRPRPRTLPMSATDTPASGPHAGIGHAHEPGFLGKYVFSTDHKIIGIQFLFSAIIFLFLGGTLALGVRTQLGWPRAEIPVIGKW